MKKKILAILMSLALIVGLAPGVTAEAATTHDHSDSATWKEWTATSGTVTDGKYYLNNEEIKATGDIIISGDVTICLNGNKLRMEQNYLGTKYEDGSDKLTICNCGNSGGIFGENADKGVINNDAGSTLTLNNAVVSSQNTYAIRNYGGTTNINDGTRVTSGTNYGIYNMQGSVCLAGGIVNSAYNHAIYAYKGITEISGGQVISGKSAVYVSGNGSYGLYLSGSPSLSGEESTYADITLEGESIFAHGMGNKRAEYEGKNLTIKLENFAKDQVVVENVTDSNKDKFSLINTSGEYVLVMGSGNNSDDLVWGEPHTNHTFDQKKVAEKYLKSEADCTNAAVYYKSCTCGERGTETFTYGEISGHTGGTASCTELAKCGECGTEYGTLASHVYDKEVATNTYLNSEATCTAKATYFKSCVCGAKGSETFEYGDLAAHVYEQKKDASNHWKECKYGEKIEEQAHVFGNDDVCDTCSFERGHVHQYDETWKTNDSKHWHECTGANCNEKKDEAVHTGGTATCTQKATCSGCSQTYGALAAHTFTQEVATDAYLKSAANCTSAAVYYKSCTCGEKSTTDTFTVGAALNHTIDTNWTSDSNQHWHKCTAASCDYKDDLAAHTPNVDKATDETAKYCTTCNYVMEAKIVPSIIEGANGTFTQGAEAGLIFKSSADFDNFEGVLVDGKEVDEKYYKATKGSIVVELSLEYLATLSKGEHTLTIKASTGDATTKFFVNEKAAETTNTNTNTDVKVDKKDTGSNVPKTGDNNNMILWSMLMLVSVAFVLGATAYRRKMR